MLLYIATFLGISYAVFVTMMPFVSSFILSITSPRLEWLGGIAILAALTSVLVAGFVAARFIGRLSSKLLRIRR